MIEQKEADKIILMGLCNLINQDHRLFYSTLRDLADMNEKNSIEKYSYFLKESARGFANIAGPKIVIDSITSKNKFSPDKETTRILGYALDLYASVESDFIQAFLLHKHFRTVVDKLSESNPGLREVVNKNFPREYEIKPSNFQPIITERKLSPLAQQINKVYNSQHSSDL